AGPDLISVTRPVSIDVIGGTGKASYRYSPHDRISPVDVTVGLTGRTNSYPFDSYHAPFAVIATASSIPSGDPQSEVSPAPTRLEFDGTLGGYRVKVKPIRTPLADVNLLALDVSVSRSRLTTVFAILILVLQALLAGAAAALVVSVWRQRRRVEIPMM